MCLVVVVRALGGIRGPLTNKGRPMTTCPHYALVMRAGSRLLALLPDKSMSAVLR